MTQYPNLPNWRHALGCGMFVVIVAALPAVAITAEKAASEPRTGFADPWAVINADGSLARGAGVVSSANLQAGRYEVIFNKDVSKCAYVATLGNAGFGDPPIGKIGVARRGGNKNGVLVNTRIPLLHIEANMGFHLFVACKQVAGSARQARTATSDRWATVDSDGTWMGGKGVVSAKRLDEGRYEVIFDRDVSNCVYVSTFGFGVSGTQVGVARRGGTTNGVFVRMFHDRGFPIDASFSLFVGCEQGIVIGQRDRWAVVNADGTLARGTGVVSIIKFGTGLYNITFDRDVSTIQCAITATLGNARFNLPPYGTISAVWNHTVDSNTVAVNTWSVPRRKDMPFHLYVGCS
jgi:hypothetical protein